MAGAVRRCGRACRGRLRAHLRRRLPAPRHPAVRPQRQDRRRVGGHPQRPRNGRRGLRVVEAVEAPVGAVREPPLPAPERKGLRDRLMAGISRNVIVLGLVSFFTDVSSEMIIPVRILFLVIVLRTPLPIAGLIHGVAERAATRLQIVSGLIADRPSRRKPLVLFGYSTSNLTKPLLALVTSWPTALVLIF